MRVNLAANYTARSIFEESVAKEKGFNIGARLKSKEDFPAFVPGPGAYNTDSMKFKKSLPSFSMGKDGRLKL